MEKTARKYTNKDIWTVTYPILISLIMEQLIGMTDTAFMGRVGEVELGASALAGVYYMIIFMIGFGFSIGAQIIIGRRNGEGNYRQIGAIFYQGILFLFALAAVMFAFSQLFSPLILKGIIQSDEVFNATISYINWRVYGFFFSFIAIMFRAFFVGTTQTKTLTLNSIVMVLSNVVFNYILVFGKFGMPALGIAGAAIGSSLSELVSLVFFIVYTCRKIDVRKYGLNRFSGFRMATLKQIFNISIWTMIQNCLSMSTWFLFFIAVEHLGERPLAITNIIRNVSSIPFMITMAFASTGSTLISNLIGAGNIACVKGTILQIIRMAALIVLPVILLFSIFPEVILHVYTDSATLVEASIPALWVLCSSYLFTLPGFIYFQAVSGTGNTRAALLLESTALTIYAAYIVYTIFHLHWDVAWCWTAEHVYSLLILTLSCLYIYKGKWQDKRI